MAEVHVPAEEATDTARLLLAAAAELGLAASVVQTSSDGVYGLMFVVPDEVADKMFEANAENMVADDEESEAEPEPEKPKRKGGRPKKAVPVVEEVTDGE